MTISERIYRILLRVYPADFRRQYGESMAQLFRDQLRDASERRQLVRFWGRTAVDLLKTAPASYGGLLSPRLTLAVIVSIAISGSISLATNIYVRQGQFQSVWKLQAGLPWPWSLAVEWSLFTALAALAVVAGLVIFLLIARKFTWTSLAKGTLVSIPLLIIGNPVLIWTFLGPAVARTFRQPFGYYIFSLLPLLPVSASLVLAMWIARERSPGSHHKPKLLQ